MVDPIGNYANIVQLVVSLEHESLYQFKVDARGPSFEPSAPYNFPGKSKCSSFSFSHHYRNRSKGEIEIERKKLKVSGFRKKKIWDPQ